MVTKTLGFKTVYDKIIYFDFEDEFRRKRKAKLKVDAVGSMTDWGKYEVLIKIYESKHNHDFKFDYEDIRPEQMIFLRKKLKRMGFVLRKGYVYKHPKLQIDLLKN